MLVSDIAHKHITQMSFTVINDSLLYNCPQLSRIARNNYVYAIYMYTHLLPQR